MGEQSVHEAAVEAFVEGSGIILNAYWRPKVEAGIAALAASAEVREGLAGAIAAHLAERIAWHPSYGATSEEQWTIDAEQEFVRELNDGGLRDAILAALAGPEAS